MTNAKKFTLAEIAQLTDCHLNGDPSYTIVGVADLEKATENDAAFLANPRYLRAMQNTQAGVVFVDLQVPLNPAKNYLISAHPSRAFQKLIDHLFPQRSNPSGFTGIHATAVIHPTAVLADEVQIGPHAVIDEGVTIDSRTFIGAGCYIGPFVSIGAECILHPHVTIREKCQLGKRVVVQPGAVIGSCGFGYTTDKQGQHTKLNQVGYVKIDDDVEIGANTTVDRARFQCTSIGKGTKIDNLVQIGHGVSVGSDNLIVALTGIAGSTTTGKRVILAGQVAVAGHLHLADDVVVTGKSGVSKSLSAGQYGGIPAMKLRDYNRMQVFLHQIESHIGRIKILEQKIKILE